VKIKINNRHAFTLIEMILAIGVAAIILISITGVLFAALGMRQATEDAVASAAPLDQTMTYLRRDLQCVVTPTNGTSKFLSGSFKLGNLISPGVSGNVQVEMFTATGALSPDAPWGDIQRVTYELKSPTTSGSQGQDLYRSVTRNLLAESTPVVTDQLMMNGVESLKFSGYDGSAWQDTWDTSAATAVNTNLPLAIRVEIQMAGNNNSQSDPVTLVVPIDSVARTNMVLSTTTTP
jgi:type II secretion system protein J